MHIGIKEKKRVNASVEFPSDHKFSKRPQWGSE
jgi:hypothetical protein